MTSLPRQGQKRSARRRHEAKPCCSKWKFAAHVVSTAKRTNALINRVTVRDRLAAYAVAEIEDQRPVAETVEDTVDTGIQCRPPATSAAIEIALDRPLLLQLSGKSERHGQSSPMQSAAVP